jgi:alpha/beta hydrolase fold
MTHPVPHWPGRLVRLAGGERVYVAQTPGIVRDDALLARWDDPPEPLGDPVLCVHGMSGTATNWTDFMAELAPDFACQALDLPGSGYSPPPKTPAGYSIKALAGTVIRLTEALGDGPVHLVGNTPVPSRWQATIGGGRYRFHCRLLGHSWIVSGVSSRFAGEVP